LVHCFDFDSRKVKTEPRDDFHVRKVKIELHDDFHSSTEHSKKKFEIRKVKSERLELCNIKDIKWRDSVSIGSRKVISEPMCRFNFSYINDVFFSIPINIILLLWRK
jgi:hypothetical protein